VSFIGKGALDALALYPAKGPLQFIYLYHTPTSKQGFGSRARHDEGLGSRGGRSHNTPTRRTRTPTLGQSDTKLITGSRWNQSASGQPSKSALQGQKSIKDIASPQLPS